MSQLSSLISRFKESGADRMVLGPDEAPIAYLGEHKRPVAGAPVRAAAILDAVRELLSQEDLEDLPDNRPRIVRHDHGGEMFVLEIVRQPNGVALGIRNARAATGAARPRDANPRRSRPPEPVPARGRRSRASQRAIPKATLDARGPVSTAPSSVELVGLDFDDVAPPGHAPAAAIDLVERRAFAGAPAPGTRRIDELLREMIAKKASDLHLSAGCHPVLRVHGEIQFARDRVPVSSAEVSNLVREIMTDQARDQFDLQRDADFAYEIPGLARFRVNVFEDRKGVGAVFRQIPLEIVPAEKLGLPKACLDLCWLSKGLVVVTGPTGSGKSTTLAAMIDFINKNRSDHIITIEDPVEFVHANDKCLVNQREVGQHTKSFKNALRAALREDPDIVLVGEMRDLETISIAIETAETGHLVFGTLHTTTAVSTIDRIIDQFPSDRQSQVRVMLSESLKGVIAQTLLPKIGGGRVAAHEVLLGTTAVSAVIRDGKTFQLPSVMQTGKALGMTTMNDSLFALVQRKQVEPKQAWIKAVDKSGLLSMFKAAGLPTTFD